MPSTLPPWAQPAFPATAKLAVTGGFGNFFAKNPPMANIVVEGGVAFIYLLFIFFAEHLPTGILVFEGCLANNNNNNCKQLLP